MASYPFAFAALLAISASVAAQVPAPAASDKAKADRKVCRAEGETGSRLTKRTCHTKAEWDQLEAASRTNLEYMKRDPSRDAYNRR